MMKLFTLFAILSVRSIGGRSATSADQGSSFCFNDWQTIASICEQLKKNDLSLIERESIVQNSEKIHLMNEQLTQCKIDVKEQSTQIKIDLKEQLTQVKSDAKEQLSRVKNGLQEQMTKVKSDVKEQLSRFEIDLKDQMTQVKSDVKRQLTLVKSDVKEQLTQIKELMEELRREKMDKSEKGCRDQFVQVGNNCMRIVKSDMNYDNVVSFCESYSAHLVTPSTRGSFGLLRNFLKESLVADNSIFWVSATDRANEGKWKWFDGSELDSNDAFYWAAGQPESAQSSENCAFLKLSSQWKLHDYRCENVCSSICQYPLK